MRYVAILAQTTEVSLPTSGGGEVVAWILLAGGIVGLFLIINRTQKRSYRHYMDRAQREAEMKANDPA
ncbi:hypothetical protein MNBD_ACTINO01-2487 [hydrothermal vent metagenome]|uniref:Uncharacterized protein n=1 Tax=hydrothermal vent metagenome TaxID=652676 RepID=A0A3B0T952_9ZZZZ